MKAWRFYGFDNLRLDEIPVPEIKPGWVLVKPTVVQLSFTEAMLAKGIRTINYEALKKKLEEQAPIRLFGHEFCATIVEVGAGVEEFAVGDRVCARNQVPCHECKTCLAGHPELCRSLKTIGFHLPGCLGEYGRIPAEVLSKVPESVSDSEAACVQPLSEAVEAVGSAHLSLGDTCVVIGAGVMGLGCIQAARASGAGTIIALDIRDEALNLAGRLGADVIVDSRTADPVKTVLELTEGVGPDVVFEAAGGGPAGFIPIHQASQMVRVKGKIIQIAHLGTQGELNYDRCRMASLQLIFPEMGSRKFMEHTLRLMANGQVSVKPMLTHILSGLERVPEAIEITVDKAKYGALSPAQVDLH